MAEVSGFSKELFVRFQSGLVLAGFGENEKLKTIATVYKKKTGRLSTYYTNIESEAKTEVLKVIATKDKTSDIYKFLEKLFDKLF